MPTSHGHFRRFEHDLLWGHRLFLLQQLHRAHGFRSRCKGSGFQAYLGVQGIPRRQAYRLIKRYLRFELIWDTIHVANAALEAEVFQNWTTKLSSLTGDARLPLNHKQEAA